MGNVKETIEILGGTFILSLLLILVGLVYFIITLWTVKTGASLLGLTPDGNWTVVSASIIAAASMLGSSLNS